MNYTHTHVQLRLLISNLNNSQFLIRSTREKLEKTQYYFTKCSL
ncbi:hypothetical protein DPMN_087939 [Dreissena polymorpha]|uniref:Uncharacterized protein n=1 Tax=Dreissena polymorpha TaxID=45954 RepID=A0A9D4QWV1_DREPO|nr:hypothetical protein DPMN_087939 [Dreissena polymorpha]